MNQAALMAQVQLLLQKIENDPALKQQFQEDPLAAIQALTGVKIPAEAVESLTTSENKLGDEGFDNLVSSVKDIL